MLRRRAPLGPFATGIRYGGDYYPEQWPREIWEEDIKLMGEAGVNMVTLGVFAWSMLEPTEGQFSFSWLKDVLDLLHQAGIGVDLGTPTAAPPPWLSVHYPGTLPVDSTGALYHHGSRQHFCVCSPDYRRFARRIVQALANEVGLHPAIELWHVHNEYACHVPYCYCANHEVAFRSWLERRYGSVGALNEAWGTAFWSQQYGSFDEVSPPRLTPTIPNPCQELDYKRFSNDAYLEEMLEEIEILRSVRPDVPVTTNFMGWFKPLDYFGWSRLLDVISTDNYQDPSDDQAPVASAMHYDLVRSLNKSKPWVVMEQTTARVNWRSRNVAKAPGEMRAYSYQAVARGAVGLFFFQWRAARSGAEKYHSAMYGHAGKESPAWAEVTQLGRELSGLADLQAADVAANVAICFSWPSWWSMEAPAKPLNELQLVDQVFWLYQPFYARGQSVDFCLPTEVLSSYEAVLLPSLYLITEPEAANLVEYVHAGGAAFVTFWSGIVDAYDRVYPGPYGGPLRSLFGSRVVEVTPLRSNEVVELEWDDGARTTATNWVDMIDEDDAEVLARLVSGPYAGRPAVLKASRGKGHCYYIGTQLDQAGLQRLYSSVPSFSTAQSLPLGVERVLRQDDQEEFEFLINHASVQAQLGSTVAPGTNMLSGSPVQGDLVLGPKDVIIVRRPLS
ncbi:MAG: beta-galactosidase [Acidimicrobiales bacterium]